jgi:hypothetical protein
MRVRGIPGGWPSVCPVCTQRVFSLGGVRASLAASTRTFHYPVCAQVASSPCFAFPGGVFQVPGRLRAHHVPRLSGCASSQWAARVYPVRIHRVSNLRPARAAPLEAWRPALRCPACAQSASSVCAVCMARFSSAGCSFGSALPACVQCVSMVYPWCIQWVTTADPARIQRVFTARPR